MCATCGCSSEPHDHSHDHDHAHDHHRRLAPLRPTRVLTLEQSLLAKNDRLAERNRDWLAARGAAAVNLVSSPGAGKTTLLERTIRDLAPATTIGVIEGDQATARDAERIRATGCRAVQINTGQGCHLDAAMVARGLDELDPPRGGVVMIENVGNLVCPALFDLGERCKVVLMSVTEGEDKPLKYPHVFKASELMLLTKTDLLPHLEFDVEACLGHVRRVNPRLPVLSVSARTGAGLDDWYGWVRERLGADG